MGDEGIGWHVIEQLRKDPRLPQDTDLLWGGTDLLACVEHMEGRRCILLVDALLGAASVGSVTIWKNAEGLEGLEERQAHAHHLSVTQALKLLPLASPALRTDQIRLFAVGISSARMKPDLSPELAAGMPHIINRVLEELAEA
jgi:hydrogenase maturation protease